MGCLLSTDKYGSSSEANALKVVDEAVSTNSVMVFSKSFCPYCLMAKNGLRSVMGDESFGVMELNGRRDGNAIQKVLLQKTGGSSVPRVFVDGTFLGGGEDTAEMAKNGRLRQLLVSKKIVS